MARKARIVVPGIPHHVTQRGNDRQNVFLAPDDYQTYLATMAQHAQECGLRILGYCLMPNHVHLIAVPEGEASLAQGIGRAHFRYTQWFNWRHDRVGHVWQGRFYSCAVDDGHTTPAMRYVECNPVRARLVAEAWQYQWSSARAHVGARDPTGMLELVAWRARSSAQDWREYLRASEDEPGLELLRSSTAGGWPLGSHEFVSDLGRRLGRRLRPRTRGRPRT